MSHGGGPGGGGGHSSSVTLTNALTAAQGLHAEAKKLPPEVRAVYLQEIKDVGALFAYTEPEKSILKGFLDQERRIALAEQVNAAILGVYTPLYVGSILTIASEGMSEPPYLERIARRTTAIYKVLADRGIDVGPTQGSAGEQLDSVSLLCA